MKMNLFAHHQRAVDDSIEDLRRKCREAATTKSALIKRLRDLTHNGGNVPSLSQALQAQADIEHSPIELVEDCLAATPLARTTQHVVIPSEGNQTADPAFLVLEPGLDGPSLQIQSDVPAAQTTASPVPVVDSSPYYSRLKVSLRERFAGLKSRSPDSTLPAPQIAITPAMCTSHITATLMAAPASRDSTAADTVSGVRSTGLMPEQNCERAATLGKCPAIRQRPADARRHSNVNGRQSSSSGEASAPAHLNAQAAECCTPVFHRLPAPGFLLGRTGTTGKHHVGSNGSTAAAGKLGLAQRSTFVNADGQSHQRPVVQGKSTGTHVRGRAASTSRGLGNAVRSREQPRHSGTHNGSLMYAKLPVQRVTSGHTKRRSASDAGLDSAEQLPKRGRLLPNPCNVVSPQEGDVADARRQLVSELATERRNSGTTPVSGSASPRAGQTQATGVHSPLQHDRAAYGVLQSQSAGSGEAQADISQWVQSPGDSESFPENPRKASPDPHSQLAHFSALLELQDPGSMHEPRTWLGQAGAHEVVPESEGGQGLLSPSFTAASSEVEATPVASTGGLLLPYGAASVRASASHGQEKYFSVREQGSDIKVSEQSFRAFADGIAAMESLTSIQHSPYGKDTVAAVVEVGGHPESLLHLRGQHITDTLQTFEELPESGLSCMHHIMQQQQQQQHQQYNGVEGAAYSAQQQPHNNTPMAETVSSKEVDVAGHLTQFQSRIRCVLLSPDGRFRGALVALTPECRNSRLMVWRHPKQSATDALPWPEPDMSAQQAPCVLDVLIQLPAEGDDGSCRRPIPQLVQLLSTGQEPLVALASGVSCDAMAEDGQAWGGACVIRGGREGNGPFRLRLPGSENINCVLALPGGLLAGLGPDDEVWMWELSARGESCIAFECVATTEKLTGSPKQHASPLLPRHRLWLAGIEPLTVGVMTCSHQFVIVDVERRALTFSCPVPAFLQLPLYPLQPRASSSGQQGGDKKSCADKVASAGMMLALCSIPRVQSLAARQCSERTTTIQKAGHAADQNLAPWLLGEGSLKRFPALPLPAVASFQLHGNIAVAETANVAHVWRIDTGEPLAEVQIFSEANENTTEIGCMRIAICSGLNGYDVAVQTQATNMCVMHFDVIT